MIDAAAASVDPSRRVGMVVDAFEPLRVCYVMTATRARGGNGVGGGEVANSRVVLV